MLNPGKLEAVTSELVRLVETTPLPPEALPAGASGLMRAARLVGVDLDSLARSTLAGSLRSLQSRASEDPAKADELAAWCAHLLAWLRDERDDPPPAELPLL